MRRSYVVGFILSLILTLVAFTLVWRHVNSDQSPFSPTVLMVSIAILAVTQLVVQLVFFLHLGRESRPFWNFQVLIFAVTIVVILVFGSLWIMQNLSYHGNTRMTPAETDKYIIEDEGID